MPMSTGETRPQLGDPQVTIWFTVTVRVAWELMLAGFRVRPGLLSDARDHALACLPDGVGADEAESLAGAATQDYLGRVRHGLYQRMSPIEDLDLTIDRRWREQIFDTVDPVGDAVLRLHFGDGMELGAVERTAALGSTVIEGAREGIREAVRAIVSGQGLEGWNDERVDRLIRRIVAMPAAGCPAPTHLLSDSCRAHLDKCPRCSRAVRLIRGGLLAPLDLVAPGGPAQDKQAQVAVILLHPDSRKHAKRLSRVLGERAIKLHADAWLVDRTELSLIGPALKSLAEDSRPPRHHLRGAVVKGPGRWSGSVLLGPVAISALDTARSRPWAEIDQLGELPAPRPPAPSALRWWLVAGVAAGLAGLVGYQVMQPELIPPSTPISVEFHRLDQDWAIRFETEDLAVVDVVGLGPDGLEVLHAGARSEKGRWATGDGRFQLIVPGAEVALIASESGVPELQGLVSQARSQAQPMVALEAWVRHGHPSVDFVVSPAIIEVLQPAETAGSGPYPAQ
jgi:hypothetical protein